MNNFAEVLNDLSANFSEKNTYIKNLCRVPLLILDDFGMERGTEYGLEQIYAVIDGRYRSGKPLIATTNLTLQELRIRRIQRMPGFMTGCWRCACRFSLR